MPAPRVSAATDRADMTWSAALKFDATFWVGDVVKNLAMAVVATAVHRAFPDLLHGSTQGHEQETVAADPASAVSWTRLDDDSAIDPNRFVSGIYVDASNPKAVKAWGEMSMDKGKSFTKIYEMTCSK